MPGGEDFGLRLEAAASAGLSLSGHLTLVGELGASHAWSMRDPDQPRDACPACGWPPQPTICARRSRCNTRHEPRENVLPFRRPDQREDSDESLVLACAGGDGRALEELFHRHGPQVHRILGRLGHVDRRDLEDLVQVTFLEVHRSAGRFSGRAAVGTWIISVALNVARHHARSESRRRSAMAAAARARVGPEPTAPTIASATASRWSGCASASRRCPTIFAWSSCCATSRG